MTDHGTSRLPVCADRKHSASQRVANEKAHRNGRAFSKLLVAWGGIEPPTQGFSALIDRFDYVRLQADAAPIKFGVRVSVLLYTLLNFASCVKVFALYPSDVFHSFCKSLCFSPQKL